MLPRPMGTRLQLLQQLGEVRLRGDAFAILYELGLVTAEEGDLEAALRYLQESFRLLQLHGEKDSPDAASTLHQLGVLSTETGDLEQARHYLTKSLHMQRRLCGHWDNLGVALTLRALGYAAAETADFDEAQHYLQESIRMQRSLHGDGENPEIEATLEELAYAFAQKGDDFLDTAKAQSRDFLATLTKDSVGVNSCSDKCMSNSFSQHYPQ